MISQTVQKNTQTHHERKLLKTYQFPLLRSVARLVKFSKQNYGCPRHTRPDRSLFKISDRFTLRNKLDTVLFQGLPEKFIHSFIITLHDSF